MAQGLLLLMVLHFSSFLSESGTTVTFRQPAGDTAVFGETRVDVEVTSNQKVDRVEVFVDGDRVGVIAKRPFSLMVDVGQENVIHTFAAAAYGEAGMVGSALVITPAVKIDLELDLPLQQLYVTATRGGEVVRGLSKASFTVIDEGVRQDLVTFEDGNVPMTLALLVDASKSMRGDRLRAALESAKRFVARLSSLDEAFVMVFSDRLHRVTTSTTELQQLLDALEGVEIGGGTALNDHLYLAMRLLEARQGRPVIVLLSDGADTLSVLRAEDVVWKLRRNEVVIYRIQVEQSTRGIGAFANAWQDLQSSREDLAALEEAVLESGGRVEVLSSEDDLDAVLDGVVDELREQYVLGYYPTELQEDGSWREVSVEVNLNEIELRTRSGYIDD